jgi:nucleoside-diphosphate-sugar epimerase
VTRVLVTGAAGIVGHYLMPRLRGAGLEVHGASRRARDGGDVVWHVADLRKAGWHEALPPMDLVLHLAPLWLLPSALDGIRALGAGRLIAFGSTSLHTKMDSPSAGERRLAAWLAEAEAALARDAGRIEWTIFRPTMIWGGGLDRNISTIARFIERFGFFPVAGRAPGLRQPVHADDLAQACMAALGNPASHGCRLDLGGGEVLSYRDMVSRIFEALDQPPRLVRLPPKLFRALVSLAGRRTRLDPAMVDRMARDMVFDPEPARRIIGYAPRPFHPARADLGVGP